MRTSRDGDIVIITANVAAGLARDEQIEAAIRAERPDIVALIDVDGHELFFVIGHPRPQSFDLSGLGFSYNSKTQILGLGDMVTDASTAVLVGDFNMTPRHTGYRRLRERGLVDDFAEKGKGRGSTFMTRMAWLKPISIRAARWSVPPVVRFDFIWCTSNIEIEEAWVVTDTGSDHAPVLARVRAPSASSS